MIPTFDHRLFTPLIRKLFVVIAALCSTVLFEYTDANSKACASYSVYLETVGTNKIKVIKAVRAQTEYGLKETKELVESAPRLVAERVSREESEQFNEALQNAGARTRIICEEQEDQKTRQAQGTWVTERAPLVMGTEALQQQNQRRAEVQNRQLDVPLHDFTAPDVSITSDSLRSKTIGDAIRVKVTATDAVGVTAIAVFVNDEQVTQCAATSCSYEENPRRSGPRNYRAVAFDAAGNLGNSKTLTIMVHASSKPGPSLSVRTDPYHPTPGDTVSFIGHGSHPAGVKDISLYINGKITKICRTSPCTFAGGPYHSGRISWRFSARSNDGGETYGSTNYLDFPEVPDRQGSCTITGSAYGLKSSEARVFHISLYGPDASGSFRQNTRFSNMGQYRFSQLPPGRYRLVIDSIADSGITVQPGSTVVHCQGSQTATAHFQFN